ncbi:MAG TPA: serine hydrolase [Candidatus Acidoferrales bacterium]|nr:serine hydrolase [Candidatus Acidoferrales bacterium]
MQSTSYTRGVSSAAVSLLALLALAASRPQPKASNDSEVATRIQRVENGIPPLPLSSDEPPMQINIEKLMQLYNVPGLSIAVIDNFKIAWAKGYGVTAAGSSTPVTVHTLFQAGSISKPVAASGTMSLVEHGQLSLDENVNQKLKSWQVPDNEFTKEQKVTLRRLLSHSAGLTVHGFPGYAVGTPIPTLVQIFNGEPPANTAPIRVEFVPGTKFQYSGGGITIEQQLVMDVTGKPFPQFMRETVLDKIGMSDSSYEQPLPPARAAATATGTSADGTPIPGKWHIYPEMAAAGLWTTPTDLAKFGIETALAKQGKANHVLDQATTREMLKPQIEQVGLGFFLDQYKNPEEFGHEGDDAGFQALLIMFADSGKGVAVMANSENGVTVANQVIRSVAQEYGWNYTPDPPAAAALLMLVANIKGPRAAITRYEELKEAGSSSPYTLDENTLIQLGYHFLSGGQTDWAIQTFKLEVQDYPKNWNSYDSLGEAYLKAGQKDLSIENYQKSVELNPQNHNGIDALKKIQEQK